MDLFYPAKPQPGAIKAEKDGTIEFTFTARPYHHPAIDQIAERLKVQYAGMEEEPKC